MVAVIFIGFNARALKGELTAVGPVGAGSSSNDIDFIINECGRVKLHFFVGEDGLKVDSISP